MENYEGSDIVNIGYGSDISIADLSALVKQAAGYEGEIVYDCSKPDGTPRKLVDTGRITSLGWKPRIGLEEGIRDAYRWFLEHVEAAPGQMRGMS